MKHLGLVTLLFTGALMGVAHAGTYGCQDQDKKAINHNAEDPTQPGTIGGCGTGQSKFENFQKDQQQLQNKQMMNGPKRLNGGDTF